MLIHNIQDLLTDTTIKAVPFNERTPVQRYTGQFSGWISVVYQRLTNALSWRHRRPTGLPHHNARNAAPTTPTATDASSPQQQPQQQAQDTLDLMSCVHGSGEDIVLLQHDLRSIGNDLALFNLLKQQIFLRRNRLILSLSCRSIQGVFFSKVSHSRHVVRKGTHGSHNRSFAFSTRNAWRSAITTHVAHPEHKPPFQIHVNVFPQRTE